MYFWSQKLQFSDIQVISKLEDVYLATDENPSVSVIPVILQIHGGFLNLEATKNREITKNI